LPAKGFMVAEAFETDGFLRREARPGRRSRSSFGADQAAAGARLRGRRAAAAILEHSMERETTRARAEAFAARFKSDFDDNGQGWVKEPRCRERLDTPYWERLPPEVIAIFEGRSPSIRAPFALTV
jgi:hypothetical protein